jgi:hypothetical protein
MRTRRPLSTLPVALVLLVAAPTTPASDLSVAWSGGPPIVHLGPLAGPAPLVAQEIPTPEAVIGFEPGEDYKLADYEQLMEYYEALAAASDRVLLSDIGQSTRGRTMPILFISSPENLARLDRWREISETLGRARDLSDAEARELAREGKAIVWIDSGLHSTEVAHSQHAPHLAYHVATDESEETSRIRENVILLLVPHMNPDGHALVVDWYREHLGTPFETTSPPEIYSEYTGHDNNRDWFMLLQAESRNVARVLYEEWYPQIVFNHHQTAPFPAMIFIPPFAEPVNPNIPPQVVRGVNLLGSHMADRFDAEGKPGVVSHMTFDMWWNGGMRTAPYFHNMLGLLSEVQHNSPTPRYVDPDDLPETFGSRSQIISATEPSIFYANPWPGGWLRLSHAVDYHLTASLATLDLASLRSEEFLYNFYQMGRDQIAAGEAGAPFAYAVPPEQWDRWEAVEMLNVLRRGGVEVHEATAPFQADGRTFPAGTHIVFAGQAFRAHLIDLMEPQVYPLRLLYEGGPPEPPYDLAGWTLPLQMGVEVARIEEPFTASTQHVEDRVGVVPGRVEGEGSFGWALSPRSNAAAIAVNRLLAAGEQVGRIGTAATAGTVELDPGSFIVEAASGTGDRIQALSDELGLLFVGLRDRPPGEVHALRPPRVGLYRSWMANIPEGWLRWILDTYEFPLENLHDQDLRGGDLSRFDIIILPAQSPDGLFRGHARGTMPPRYVGGVGTEGVRALQEFVRGGGTLLALDGATDVVMEQFGLPLRSELEGVPSDRFFIPGSLLRVNPDPEHPLAFGMQPEAVGTFVTRRGSQSRAFRILPPARAGDQRAPEHPVETVVRWGRDDLLLSGWALGEEEHLAGRPAALRVREGEGDLVLLGFRAGFRGQPRNSFKLLFNSIYASAADGLLRPPVADDGDGD